MQSYKLARDNLTAISPNLNTVSQMNSERTEIFSKDANDHEAKLKTLSNTVENLRYENESMNAMVRNKNQEILNLKAMLKGEGKNNDSTKSTKDSYHMNNLRNHEGELPSPTSVELDKAIYQMRTLEKENEELKNKIEDLQKSIGRSGGSVYKNEQFVSNSIGFQEHKRIVEQYQDKIDGMAEKIKTVNKIELELKNTNQEKALILEDFENIRQELFQRTSHCEFLENELRVLDKKIGQRDHNNQNQKADYDLLKRCNALEVEIEKLNKQMDEKDLQIVQNKMKNNGCIEVSKQAFDSMQYNISSLQERLNVSNTNYRKETEKSGNLQIELVKVNREFGDKSRKLEMEENNVKRLEREKTELTTNLAKSQASLKELERKLEEKSVHLHQNTKQVTEIDSLNRKINESKEKEERLTAQITILEANLEEIKRANLKSISYFEEIETKWSAYEKAIKDQNEYIQAITKISQERLDEIDTILRKNTSLQEKLRELSRRDSSLVNEVEQNIIKSGHLKGLK